MSEDQKTAHTPGPWQARKAAHGPIDIFDRRNLDVVTVYGGGVESEAREANARLIAAAPDLLEALKDVVIAYRKARVELGYDDDGESDSIAIAEEAIAKAEGRS